MLFISSEKLLLSLRYSNNCISLFPFFFPAGHCCRGLLKIIHKVYIFPKNSLSVFGHFVGLTLKGGIAHFV